MRDDEPPNCESQPIHTGLQNGIHLEPHHRMQRTEGVVADPNGAAWRRLIGCWSIIAAFWLVVLPWLAAQPSIQSRLSDLQSQGIDPSAMFYTELEAMEAALTRIDRFHHEHPDGLWRPAAAPRR